MKPNHMAKYGMAAALMLGIAGVPASLQAQANNDQQMQSNVQHELDSKRYGGVQVQVRNGVVTLNGQVATLADKMDAEKKAHKAARGAQVNDQLAVAAGENVSDQQLWQALSKKLVYDRVGYGTTPFNALSLNVRDGVATVSGVVVDPADKDSALNLIKNYPGVRGLVDRIQVAPPSPMDDRIRQQEFRAIYGAPQLNRYAMDPAKPIRIAVVNGHVTLEGVVDNEGDKNVAGIRANAVPGVFSVNNHLQVAGQVER